MQRKRFVTLVLFNASLIAPMRARERPIVPAARALEATGGYWTSKSVTFSEAEAD